MQNAKSSHTHRRMQTRYHQKKLISDSPSRIRRSVQPVKCHYAYHCHISIMQIIIIITGINGRQEKIRKVPVEL